MADDVIDHLVHTYGSGLGRVLAHLDERADGHVRVCADSPVIHAELIHGVRDEMAHTVEDLLRRRTELGARGVSDNAVLARIAHVLDHELGRHRMKLD